MTPVTPQWTVWRQIVVGGIAAAFYAMGKRTTE